MSFLECEEKLRVPYTHSIPDENIKLNDPMNYDAHYIAHYGGE